ncbi:alpha/beta hydrolase family protein [Limnoglobus roseus]|uniref:S9 family peptidase n=1 Tax=Limnoglobus roseus TaxID=2598579 RepID=A0A5C1A5R7_9BACT|nr:S9 family peptidase [Limnoglobus roseus]QEL13172.1 S9 family peptidase [Limnoglobus roseus]
MRSAVVLLLLAVPAFAQEPTRTHAVTVDDYFTLAGVAQIAVSPDGKQVAYTEARWDKADDLRKSDLWVLDQVRQASSGRRLTFDRANDRNPKWGDDGKVLYFLGNRKREGEKKPPYDGSTQVWRINPAGGDPAAVTRVEGGVTGFDVAAGGAYLFYSVDKTHHDEDDFAKLRAKTKADYGHGVRKVSEVYRLNVRKWRSEKVVDDTRYVREFSASADGRRLGMITAFDDTVVKSEGESRVDVWTEGGKVVTPPTEAYRAKASTPNAWLGDVEWSPDGKRFAFCLIFDGHPAEVVVGTESSAGWEVALLERAGWEVVGYGRALGTPIQWLGTDELLVQTEKAGRVGVRPVSLAKTVRHALPANLPDNVLACAPVDDDASTVVTIGGGLSMPVVTKHGPKGPPVQLLDPNWQAADWKLPTVKHVTWKAADGTEVGGVLELPPDYKAGTKLPLVVGIHGGPTTSTKDAVEFDPHNGRLYFAVNGYAVLFPNYRGSTGYGDKFVRDLIGNENNVEVNDIIAGVQHLVKEGIADGDRVGVMGWSNGGYLTNCLITRKDLPFKLRAASSGAGIVDSVAEWGFNDEPAYPKVFKKGHPWEAADEYKKTSPTYALGNVTTPTLIHVGGNDVRCPPGHSRMLYRALKEYLKVPTELIEYPGEPHGLTKMSHRKAKMEWDLAWFEKYLKNAK